MELNRQTRRRLRLEGTGFILLFLAVIALLAYLSTRYSLQADWTAAGRHTLSEASRSLLETLDGEVAITAYARDSELLPLRKRIRDLIDRYQRLKPDIRLEFVDPDSDPERVRADGIGREGELVVNYQGRRENVTQPDEESLSNALQRLARAGERSLRFIAGHGERDPEGQANHDLGLWGEKLREKGYALERLFLAEAPQIPKDTSVLVIAGPQVDLLPGEVKLIGEYLKAGGNLLWLAEPEGRHGLEPLAAQLGLRFQPGVAVDATGQMLGLGNPAMVVIPAYPPHPVTEELVSLTLFPQAAALALDQAAGWSASPLLETVEQSWTETGPVEGTIRYDQGSDVAGPLQLGVALTRPRPGSDSGEDGQAPQQRVVVIGDGDFLSNTYLGNGANLELGNRLVNWLSHDDRLIRIPPRRAPDTQLTLSPGMSYLIGFVFLIGLPGAFLFGGLTIWLRRRKR